MASEKMYSMAKWNRRRISAIAGALVLAIWIPVALAQNYFRYNAWILPVTGLLAVLFYGVLAVTAPSASAKINDFHRGFGTANPLRYLAVIAVIGGSLIALLGGGEWYAIRKSQAHVVALRTADSPKPPLPSTPAPKQPIVKAIRQGNGEPGKTPKPSEATKTDEPAVITMNGVTLKNSGFGGFIGKGRGGKVVMKDTTANGNGSDGIRIDGANKVDLDRVQANINKDDGIRVHTQQPIASGLISQTNSGGLTVQQATTGSNSPIINSPITVGDIPKSLSSGDKLNLIALFNSARIKATVEIMADQLSGVAPFPDDFYDALKVGGWTMAEPGVNHYLAAYAPGRLFQGAEITSKGDPVEPGGMIQLVNSDPLYYIAKALQSHRVDMSFSRSQNQKDGLINIRFLGGFKK
jgi:hypothetical protein